MLQALLALPGLGALLQGLLKLLATFAVYEHGKAVARDEDRISAARAEAGAAQVRLQVEIERRVMDRAVDRAGADLARQRLRASWARQRAAARRP